MVKLPQYLGTQEKRLFLLNRFSGAVMFLDLSSAPCYHDARDAMSPSRVEIHIERPFSPFVDRRQLRKLIRDTLAEEGTGPAVVDLVVTDDETVRRLNATYRGRDETTDVLSFSLREGTPFVTPPDGLLHLGEVIISYPQAARQAGEKPVSVEMAHLVVHGLLHLLGYDHEAAEAAVRMRAQEARHLNRCLSQGA